jgi:hypothetical protein
VPGAAERIRTEIRKRERATAEILVAIDTAIAQSPNNSELWLLRGDAIQLSDDVNIPFTEVDRSYKRAAEIDGSCAEAYESLGYFWFAVMDDAASAIPFFERAVALGAGPSAQDGLRQAKTELRERTNESAV